MLHCFLENDRIARNLDYVAVEHRIVLSQEISLVYGVHDHGDHARVRLHHTLEINLVDGQATLAGAAPRTQHAAIDYWADKGIATAGQINVLGDVGFRLCGLLLVFDRNLLLGLRFLVPSRTLNLDRYRLALRLPRRGRRAARR